jgi:hypothetical protein
VLNDDNKYFLNNVVPRGVVYKTIACQNFIFLKYPFRWYLVFWFGAWMFASFCVVLSCVGRGLALD